MMTTLDRSFVDGVFWRMIAIGAVLALITALAIDLRFGWSLAVGAVVGAGSLRVTTVAVERIFRAAIDGDQPGGVWAVVVGLKLLALLAVVFVVLAIFRANAIAFVIGFKMIFPALAWQAIRDPGHLQQPADDADDTESP